MHTLVECIVRILLIASTTVCACTIQLWYAYLLLGLAVLYE